MSFLTLKSELKGFLGKFPLAVEIAIEVIEESNPIRMRKAEQTEKAHLQGLVREQLIEQGVVPDRQVLTASHSHFKKEMAVIVLGSDQEIGVDLENCCRPIHQGLMKKISKGIERSLGLSVLELWVLKEAAFKANPKNQGTVVSDYQVQVWNKEDGTGMIRLPGDSPGKVAFAKIVRVQGWLVGCAWLQRES